MLPIMCAILILLTVVCEGALGQEQASEPESIEPPEAALLPKTHGDLSISAEERVNSLVDAIEALEVRRKALKKELSKTQDEEEIKRLKEEGKRLSQRIDELRDSFEELFTGSETLDELERPVERKIDWRQELEDIVRPLLEQVKVITERPRTIERLRSERQLREGRLRLADRTLTRLNELRQGVQDPEVLAELDAVQQRWQTYREETAGRLEATRAQLERALAPREDEDAGIVAGLKEFLRGRGLNLLLAIFAFFATFAALLGIGRLAGWLTGVTDKPSVSPWARATGVLYRVVVITVATFASMAVLYARGDWLILGLLIILVFGILLGLRQSLPRLVRELRVLLNMGGVREGERVIYQGIPWKLSKLHVYSTLTNPLLRGGVLRLPLEKMIDLSSRPYSPDEPWFPSRENDFVMFDGDIFGKVLMQTPEVVQVQTVGATTTFSVSDYLAKNPRNLSQDGFAVPVTFGLDYRHQDGILTTILDQLRAHLTQAIKEQPYHGLLKDLIVDFNEAASSSLNVIVVAIFQGSAAEHYWPVRRLIQKTIVDACNQHGWVIPFNQLTVHVDSMPEKGSLLK